MEDRTEELRGRIEELDSMHDEWLRKAQLALGRLLVLWSRTRVGRWLLAVPFSRLSAYFVVERGFMGVEKVVARDAVAIAYEWLKIPTFIRMPYVLESASDDRVDILWHECAVGYEDPSCLQACRTSCNIDIEIVKRLGGRLEVTENMLEGAPCCRFVITRR